MVQQPNNPVLRYFHKLFEQEELSSLTDRQLLQRFASQRCEAAFSALVRRHGPMVLGVCSRILKDASDAEDAVQATFLVLARKGRGFGWQDSIGNWLYGVALRVAFRMRSQRQRSRDLSASLTSEDNINPPSTDPASELTRRELTAKLDDSLRRLPDKYRAPLVLCYLEGKTHQEAAQELKLPAGSISRHVSRGLELLRERLGQGGLCISVEVLTALLAKESWRPTLQTTLADAICESALAVQAGALVASGTVSARILTLAEGVSRTMFFSHLKYVAAVLFTVGALGVGGVMHGPWHADGAAEPTEPEQGQQTKAPIASPGGSTSQPAENQSVAIPGDKEGKHRAMWSKLEGSADVPGFDKITFGEAKQFFEERFGLKILISEMPFKVIDGGNILEAQVKLDKVSGVPLRVLLQLVLEQFGATYLVHRDFIEVTTPAATRPESWIEGDRSFVPRVFAEFKDQPLDEALRELSLQTGISVILDQRSLESMPRVTALLNNVGLDTAVEILANMCGMKAVALDRSLYVTRHENALEIIQEKAEVAGRKGPGKQQAKGQANAK